MNALLALLLLIAAGCTALAVWLSTVGVRYAPAKRTLDLRVTRRIDHPHGLFTLVLQRSWFRRWQPLPRFASGQSVQLSLPGVTFKRRYSLARWQGLPFRYELTIKHEQNGKFSAQLAERAQVGVRLNVSPPSGRFVLPLVTSPRRAVMIAGGVGITPLLAMIDQWLRRADSFAELHCYWQVRYEQEWMYRDSLERIARLDRRLQMHYLCSRPTLGTGERISAASIEKDLGALNDASFFLCASNALLDALIAQLQAAGVSDEHIHFERFGLDGAAVSDEQWQLTFDNRQIAFHGHASVLDALEDAGVAITADCRSGTCGDCRLKLLDGTVRKLVEPEFATPIGQILACCYAPTSNVRLQRAT